MSMAVVEGFQRGSGGDQHRGGGAEAGADHGHVACVVDDAFLLLEGGLVLFVDDDETEVGKGQEQRGAGADDDGGGAFGDGTPGGAAGARCEVGVPDSGGDAEAALEALQPLGGEGDLREHDERLAALAEGFRDGFQVGLGLAGAGYSVEQGDAECARGDGGAEDSGGGSLVGGEDGALVVGVGDREGRRRGEDGGFQQPGIRHAADDAGAGAGGVRQLAGGAGFVLGQRVQHLLAGCGDAGVGRGKDPAPAGGRRGGGAGDDAERHGHDLAGGRERVAGDPVHELAERRQHGRRVDHAGNGLQLAVRDRVVGAMVPDDANLLAAIEGNQDDIAGFWIQVGWHPVVERPGKRVGQQNRDPARRRCHSFRHVPIILYDPLTA
jgi:hypothetical protein